MTSLTSHDVVIVDSSVWIDLVTGIRNSQTSWLNDHLDEGAIALTDLILCEVLQGFSLERDRTRALLDLSEFEMYDVCGRELAVAAATNYRILRRKGLTVRTTIDCLIATFCIQKGFFLLHRDRDFVPFEEHLGLRVVHPAPPRVQ